MRKTEMTLFLYTAATVFVLIRTGQAQNCINPSAPRNGTVKETKDWRGNKMLHFSCDQGYILVGSEVLTCKGNEWSDEVPECGVTDCQTHYLSGSQVSGLYEVIPDGQHRISVLCDMTTAGGGWTVFQQRLNNFTSFYKGWQSYKEGFGDNKGNFWLGLDTLYQITWKNMSELYIEMEGDADDVVHARYKTFQIGSEEDQYRLTVGGYSGTAGDSLSYHNHMRFSTKDRDNDVTSEHCARIHNGAWWYNSCDYSDLNGLYRDGWFSPSSKDTGIEWHHYKKNDYFSMRRTKMMLR